MAGHAFGSINIKNNIITAAGSAAAPSLYFSTNSGSGLYQIGANNIGVAISGSKVVDIASTGLNVIAIDAADHICISKFLNPSEIATKFVSIAVGNAYSTSNCATFGYTLNSTLANSTGSLGIYTNNIINWKYNSGGYVGINQAPGTEALEVTGNIKASGTISTPQIYLDNATPANQGMGLSWNVAGGLGRGTFINNRGTNPVVPGGFEWGTYESSTYKEVMRLHPTRMYAGYGMGVIDGTMTNGQSLLLSAGKSYGVTNESALLAYTYNSGTLADSYGALCLYGATNAISFNGSNKVGINQVPGTEALEVTGSIKAYANSDSQLILGKFLNAGLATTGNTTFISVGKAESANNCALLSYYYDAGTLANSIGRLGIYANGYSNSIIQWSYNTVGRVGINQAPGTDTLEVAGTIRSTTGDIVSEASRVFLQGAAPNQDNALFMRWQGGTGKSYIVCASGSGSGEIGMGHYNSSSYKEQFAIGLTGGIRVYNTGGTGSAAIGQFYNTDLAAGNDVAILLGKNTVDPGDNAWMLYHRDASTLANSIGKLGIWAYNSSLTWGGSGKVGIGDNKTPGTETLEVAGNIACTDLKPSGAYYWQPAQNFYLTATGNNSEWSMDLTPGTYTGVNWSVFNSTTGQPALSVGVSNAYNGKVGINQAYGTENLEVNGTAYITSPVVWLKYVAPTGTGAKAQGSYLLWNMYGGSGRTYLVNEQGLGSGGISLGRFDHSSGDFVEYMGLDNIGNLNVNYSGGLGGSDIAKFFNSSLAAGQSMQMHIGKAIGDSDCAWFQFVNRNPGYSNQSYGVIGVWGNGGNIFFNRAGSVGIAGLPGSNAFEVNGSLSANNYPSSVTSYQTNIVTNGTPVTMTANTLYYQRTGNVVHVMGTLSWSAAGDGSSTYPSIFLPIAAGVGIYAPVTYTNGTTGLVHTTGGWVQAYLHNADGSQVTPFNSLGMGSGSMWINFSYVI